MHHFRTIGELIDEIEQEAARVEQRIPEQPNASARSNTRGYAAAHRAIAAMMRRTYIGPDRDAAVLLELCGNWRGN